MKITRLGATVLTAGIALLASAGIAHAGAPVAVSGPETLTLLSVGAAAVGAVSWWRKRK